MKGNMATTQITVSWLAALLLALTAGTTLAASIDCPGGGGCVGTAGDDTMRGTATADGMDGSGGADKIYGLRGGDALIGGAGKDYLSGGPGADLLDGGRGDDTLVTTEYSGPSGQDTVRGGAGIVANDGYKDLIDCGDGLDSVSFDQGLDEMTGCETRHPY